MEGTGAPASARPVTMMAVRCAARRLGGSLFQRTQAEEGRRLAPSRLLRSRGLHNERAWEIPEPDLESNLQQKRAELRKSIDKLKKFRENAGPDYSKLPLVSIAREVDGVIRGAAKWTFVGMLTIVTFEGKSEKCVEAKAVIKENQ